jgi:hypothetical protein
MPAALLLMRYSTTPLSLDLGAGVLIGFGLFRLSRSTRVVGIQATVAAREARHGAWRGHCGPAARSGKAFFVHAVRRRDDQLRLGWRPALTVFALLMLLDRATVCSRSRRCLASVVERSRVADQQSFKTALAEAFSHRLCSIGAWLFHLRLPARLHHRASAGYLSDRGVSAQTGGWVIAAIGLFNIIGSLGVGWLQNIFPKRYILSAIYFTRALSIVAFISFPITTFSAIMFGAVTGLTWLSTVPPTRRWWR